MLRGLKRLTLVGLLICVIVWFFASEGLGRKEALSGIDGKGGIHVTLEMEPEHDPQLNRNLEIFDDPGNREIQPEGPEQ